mmetsp:Transcript_30729/g.91163  ORF Transcript_30729/g.91163 Transcript_30729/m.91163 type:complete len:235 (-) Transcript_30729:1254-1958(-)
MSHLPPICCPTVASSPLSAAQLSHSPPPPTHSFFATIQAAEKHGVSPLLLLNTKGGAGAGADASGAHARIRELVDPAGMAGWAAIDLGAASVQSKGASVDVPTALSGFLQDGVAASRARETAHSLPSAVLSPEAAVFLNIPMDAETPTMRLLRPQALVQEEAIRHWATTTAYRMDLAAARSGDPQRVAKERARFDRALEPLLKVWGGERQRIGRGRKGVREVEGEEGALEPLLK